MGNFLYSCCPPSAYSLVRYQAVTVRPRRGSEDERLENGWQSAGASSDDELILSLTYTSDEDSVIYEFEEHDNVRNEQEESATTDDRSSSSNLEAGNLGTVKQLPLAPNNFSNKISKKSRHNLGQNSNQFISKASGLVTRFEQICFDINNSSESINDAGRAKHSTRDMFHRQEIRANDRNDELERSMDAKEGFINETKIHLHSSSNNIYERPAPTGESGIHKSSNASSTDETSQLCQSFTGLHTGAVQEHHLASLIVNPLADTEPFTYSSPPREPVTLAHDLLEVQSQRTTSIELEWDQEPDMSQYKSTKALHTTSHTVDSSMGGLSSSRLRSLCSTPASLEWDFKESTTSLQAAPLVTQEDEDLWGASETEELLQEIELLASRALRDEDELEPELDDRSFDER
ncbi:uncharacterized protein LOC108671220 isoform X2 [Hyalella azteca]|uniref:Uncharacterized protein LOC108671220 isoform X2 n=1 Tax=Hyalella azteca TaxID=294128 RepID=A0A8B7NLT8_HYAAZ|nr:uncharacterized protein LOC108671220 isoform X2 [Hyalella azteca]